MRSDKSCSLGVRYWVLAVASVAMVQPRFTAAQALTGSHGLHAAQAESVQGSVVAMNLKVDGNSQPLGAVAVPEFGWTLRANDPAARGVQQSAYRVLVASSSAAIVAGQRDMWDSGKVVFSLASSPVFSAVYGGKPLASATTYYWAVQVWNGADRASAWSEVAQFTTGLLHPEDWKAHWIADEQGIADVRDGAPQEKKETDTGAVATAKPKPLPLFRKEFSSPKKLAQALLFISGLGQYEAHINGRNVTDAVLTPGWTDYRKHIFYNTYDVTALVQPGANALGVMLGNGMYNVERTPGRYTKFVGTFGQPKLILQLHLRYDDGTAEIIASDAGWKTAPGPIIFTSIYGGEDYDARLEQAGWDLPGFDDHAWSPVVAVNGPGGLLVPERAEPLKVTATYPAVKVTEPKTGPNTEAVSEPKGGIKVYDLGQNFAGWPEITVSGEAGATVKLIAGELLDANGFVTQRSANAFPKGPNSFSYVLRGAGTGEGVERWHPRFSYYGFRYVQVETTGEASVKSISGEQVHAAVEVTGQFASSDDLFVRIHKLIDAAIVSNMVSVLTDCPHREKLGWLEQTHLAGASMMYNYGLDRLYHKMASDMQDEQLPDGMVPGTAPEYVQFLDRNGKSTNFRDSPEWGSAVILSPWNAYQFYGDVGILRAHYEAMQRYADYLKGRAHDHMVEYGLGDWYDIGPRPPGYSQLTGAGLTATAIYYQDVTAMQQIAQLLGKREDGARYAQEAAAVKDAFNAHLFHADTDQYDRGSQTANAMPLALGLVPQGHRDAVLANLVADIRAHGNHVTAGDVGFHYVVEALAQNGRSDVLYDMLSRTDSPSYGYQLAKGATALTEAWDTNPNSSQNHFMLGHGEEWFYRWLAGMDIDLSRAPDERIRIAPTPVGDVQSASASFDSIQGEVKTAWSRSGDTFNLAVTIPAGAVATVVLPPAYTGPVTESGLSLAQSVGVHAVPNNNGAVHLVVGSGTYNFQAQMSH